MKTIYKRHAKTRTFGPKVVIPASNLYGSYMGTCQGPIWANHMGPTMEMQLGSIWVPSESDQNHNSLRVIRQIDNFSPGAVMGGGGTSP